MNHTIRLSVPVETRDGVILSTDLYLPDEGGTFPALLCRTIYDKQEPRYVEWAMRFVEAGYAVALQDCRGRYDSDGDWEPYVNEAFDGVDTLQWVGEQAWCDGNIGAFGRSYLGFTQILPAPYRVSALKAVMPLVNQEDNFGHIWINGVFQLHVGMFFLQVGRHTMQRTSAPHMDFNEIYRRLPIYNALDGQGGAGALKEFLSHPTFDDYWQSYSMKGRYADIDVPAYFVTGWYDTLVHEQFKLFQGWRSQARTPEARNLTKILVGPWSHSDIGQRPTVGPDLGGAAVVDIPGLHIRWYDQRLRGVDTGIDREEPIRLWVMGENVWRYENEWPLARAQNTAVYLSSGGRANTRSGDGVLSFEPKASAHCDGYAYDPAEPVPSVGGQYLFPDKAGARDRLEIEEREDVLVYTSEPLAHDLEATGPVHLILYAASSAVDTDFTAALVDVSHDQTALIICEGIVRARYRESLEQPSLITPGSIYRYCISLWETSYLFKRGHSIRLEISSSNFPRFDRNLNTGGLIGMEDRWEIARQTIYHDEERQSHLLLPIVPR
jgi:uncharacterized protein